MNVDILKGGDWSWSVAANLGLNRNKITELYGGKSEIITSNAGSSYAISMDKILTPGQDVDTWYGTEWAGEIRRQVLRYGIPRMRMGNV